MSSTPSTTPTLGQDVIYRSRTGSYSCPAKVAATTDSLNPEGVEYGRIYDLDDEFHVHLVVFTAGVPGQREGATDFQVESEHPVSENVSGTYQEWNVPFSSDDEPGTWNFME